jgi:hypothetical protein
LSTLVLAIRVPNQIDFLLRSGVVLPPQSSSYVSSQFKAYLVKSCSWQPKASRQYKPVLLVATLLSSI